MKYMKRCFALALCLLLFACGIGRSAALAAEESPAPSYSLTTVTNTVEVQEDETPLAAVPDLQGPCCMLHFVLMLLVLGFVFVYAHDSRIHQRWIFRLRWELEE